MAVVDTVAPATEEDPPVDEGSRRSRIDLGTVVGLAVTLVGLGLGASRLGDNSFLTHLATGREMLDSGVVRNDVFTWTSAGESIVVQSWLASLAYGVVDAVAGFHGLRLFTALLAAVLAALCWKLTESSSSILTRLAIMVPVLVIGRTTWSERPLLIAFVLLAAACFARSSPRFHCWLLQSQLFGPMVRRWQADRCVSRRTKIVAMGLIATTFAISIGYATSHLAARVGLAAAGVGAAAVIARLPTCPGLPRPS